MGTYNAAGKSSWKGWLLQWTSRLAAIRANAVVLMSAKMKSYLSPTLYNKTYIIPEGIDANMFTPMPMQEAKRRLGWDEAKQYILFFDNGKRVKNAAFAVQVMQEVQKLFPHATMVRVQNVSHQQLPLYYNAAHALLLPSLHEGSNNSLKEALACNCPVVASAVGDAEERLAGVSHCVVIKGFEIQNYVAALGSILQANERSNGRHYIEPITHTFIGNQLKNLYAQLTQHSTAI
jgi:glycosyltransferase involved in cell wall biosynthesis